MASKWKARKVIPRSVEHTPELILEVESVSGDSYAGRCIESASSQSIDAEVDNVVESNAETYVDTALEGEFSDSDSDSDSDLELELESVDLTFFDDLSGIPDRPLRFTLKKLYDWCVRNNVKLNLKKVKPEVFDKILCRFYVEVRSKTGQRYARNTIVAIRYGLNRHFQNMNPPRKIDIIEDAEFKHANEVFKKVVTSAAKENPNRLTVPMRTEDLRKIYNSDAVSPNNPLTLLLKVWFELSIYFSQNRTKLQRETKSNDFVFDVDNDGRRYATLVGETQGNIRMYEKPLDELCPVTSLEKLLMKIDPSCRFLFQRPRQVAYGNNRLWFHPERVGRNFMSQMMSKICKLANLETKYTNLSLKKLAPWGLEELVFHHRQLIQSGVCRQRTYPVPIAPKTTPSNVSNSQTSTTTSAASRDRHPGSSTKTVACNTDEHRGAFQPYVRKRAHGDQRGSISLDVPAAKSKIKRIFQRLEYTDLVTFLDWLKRIDVLKDTSGTILCRENCFTLSEQAVTARHFTPQQIQPALSTPTVIQQSLPSLILPSPLSLSQYYMNNSGTTMSTAVRPAAFLLPTLTASADCNAGFVAQSMVSVQRDATPDVQDVRASVGPGVLESPEPVLPYCAAAFPPTRSSLCLTRATNQCTLASLPAKTSISGSLQPFNVFRPSLVPDNTTTIITSHGYETGRPMDEGLFDSRQNKAASSDPRRGNQIDPGIGPNNCRLFEGAQIGNYDTRTVYHNQTGSVLTRSTIYAEGSPQKKLKISHVTGESKEWKIL